MGKAVSIEFGSGIGVLGDAPIRLGAGLKSLWSSDGREIARLDDLEAGTTLVIGNPATGEAYVALEVGADALRVAWAGRRKAAIIDRNLPWGPVTLLTPWTVRLVRPDGRVAEEWGAPDEASARSLGAQRLADQDLGWGRGMEVAVTEAPTAPREELLSLLGHEPAGASPRP